AIQRMENVPYFDAVRIAGEYLSGGAAAPLRPASQPPLVPRQTPPPHELSDTELEVIDAAARFYASRLPDDPDALAYLRQRGLDSAAAQSRGVGVCRGLGLTDFLLRQGLSLEAATSVGILNERRREKFRDRLILPHREGGRVTWLVGRLIDTEQRRHRAKLDGQRRQARLRGLVRRLVHVPQESPERQRLIDFITGGLSYIEWVLDQPKYLNIRGPRPIFWLPDGPVPVLFLVEGPADAMVLNQWGFPAAAICGSGISASQLARLRDFPYLPIFRDAGDNGRMFAEEWAQRLGAERCPIIDPPEGFKDAGEIAQDPNGRAIAECLLAPVLTPRTTVVPASPIASPASPTTAEPTQQVVSAGSPGTAVTTASAGPPNDQPASAAFTVGSKVTALALAVCPSCGTLVYPAPTLNCCGCELPPKTRLQVLWVRGEVFKADLYEFDTNYLPSPDDGQNEAA
ncbi:MAG TPA: hypothetical protein VMW62_13975, partial [Chloroflexota bacterium]|nr:hypothetical protein [Chloroflexota bacterium]